MAPYSGTSLYQQTYVPANLQRIAPGDVLDLTGQYDENTTIGTAVFPAGRRSFRSRSPTVTFRYEYAPPRPGRDPLVSDLNDFNLGRQWHGDARHGERRDARERPVERSTGASRRLPHVRRSTAAGVEISNELFDVQGWNATQSTSPSRRDEDQIAHRDRDVVQPVPHRATLPRGHRAAVTDARARARHSACPRRSRSCAARAGCAQ